MTDHPAEPTQFEANIASQDGRRRFICDRCGFEMVERNCKVICPNCGSRYDCSDLSIYFDELDEGEQSA